MFAVPEVSAAELLREPHLVGNAPFTVIGAAAGSTDMTYSELREKSARFAAALTTLGVRRGHHVATLVGNSAELAIALLGMWRLGVINVPLLSEYDHEGIALRLLSSGARLVICDADQRRKLLPQGEIPNDASPLVVVTRGEAFGYDLAFSEMVAGTGAFAQPHQTPVELVVDAGLVAMGDDDVLALLFAPAVEGVLKDVPIPLAAVESLIEDHGTAPNFFGDDVFWKRADPGWGYGPYFALLAQLAAAEKGI